MRTVTLLIAALLSLTPAPEGQPTTVGRVNLPSMGGKTRAQLKPTFPTLQAAGSRFKAVGWRGWKEVLLEFGSKGQLVAVTLTPTAPLSEDQANRLLTEQLGVKLQAGAFVAAPAARAYRNMAGPIRTIDFVKAEGGSGYQVSDIAVFFNIPY